VLIAALLVLGLLLLPDSATAWGPITHLAHGSEVLKSINTLQAGLQQLLAAESLAYLYGCVGADITMAKRFTPREQAHCHSWEVGWQVLAAARSDRERAFAFGYLTHLGADVFSHNHFVPTQLIVSFRARALRHLYWEARFDSMQALEYRAVLRELRGHVFTDCDDLIRRVVARTIVPFHTGKQIFDSVLAFHDWDNWHVLMRNVTMRSRYHLPEDLVGRYNTVCIHNATDVLRRGRQARCQAADPSGLDALTMAKRVRRTLKQLERRGRVSDQLEDQIHALNARGDLHPDALPRAPTDMLRARA
jgi:hypothetical protein